MNQRKIAIALLALGAWLAPVVEAHAATPAPMWKLTGIPLPTHFVPGSEGRILLVATNIGGAPTAGTITVTDTLPLVLTPIGKEVFDNDPASPSPACEISGQTITCTDEGPISPGRQLEVSIFVDVDPLAVEGILPDEAIVSGGAPPASISTTTTISSTPAPFGFLAPSAGGPEVPITEAGGAPAKEAGTHPYQLTASAGFPTEEADGVLVGAGHARNVTVDLPRGLIINPSSTPVLCTEAQLVTEDSPGCPEASQVGTISVVTVEVTPKAATSPLFNMVPPPGTAASLGFNALGIGVFVHLNGSVRSDGDYGLSGASSDILALTAHPVFGARVELWGDPSSPSHDKVRGHCLASANIESCPVEPTKTALLSMPGDCPGNPIETRMLANSWEEPNVFKEASYKNADLTGTPVPIENCNDLEFEPKIQVKPTTSLTDSPSGLDFNLHQRQNTDLGARSTANLKDATLTLPEGLVVNPSAAQGQGACTTAQVGLTTPIGQAPIHFSKEPAMCPDAAKIGTVEVSTPLLAQVDQSGTKVLHDPEGNPIPRPIEGAIYLAKPFQNPFGSLLAVYLSVEDPRSGTVAKFAARVQADPVTGQLRNILTEGPELPIEDVRVHLFTGPRAALRTPPACASYAAGADLIPWSAPDRAVNTTDSFAITSAAGGGPCPSSANSGPNKPSFTAGTITPRAGAYSPFVLTVSREDGSQPLAGFEATLPAGLTAKLAGIPYCSEAEIAQAQARSHPNEGAIEQASPSCPGASEVGSVDVAAGAGPTPLHTSGRVYLAGPYRGAPLSFVIITPAVVGPFDLGTVVVRSAAYLNPETAIVRAVSDPLPTILEGIPLDLRSATVRMGHPQFTLNPTSCDRTSVLATTTSIFGQGASLSSPFQVGGCAALGFKPKFNFKLKGATKRTGHPALRVEGHFSPGQANLERAAIALPRSEFLDQAHIGSVCTRVQFAAHQCPAKSVYGFAKATTPLLDKPLEGPVYLRSSSHELPDIVFALGGQVEVVLASRVDSVNGGIRATAEHVPDAPVTKFVLEMRGGRKGLLINSTNLCAKPSYATVKLDGHNGRAHDFKSLMKNDCGKKPRKGKGKSAHHD